MSLLQLLCRKKQLLPKRCLIASVTQLYQDDARSRCVCSTSLVRSFYVGPDSVVTVFPAPASPVPTTLTPPTTEKAITQRIVSVREGKRYLDQEQFPLGSFDSKAGEEVISLVGSLVNRGSPEDFEVAIELLRRLFQELKFAPQEVEAATSHGGENNGQQQHQLDRVSRRNLVIPGSLLPRVIEGWERGFMGKLIEIDPRTVFDLAKDWESHFPRDPFVVEPYRLIIQVASTHNNPEFTQEILDHLLDSHRSDFLPKGRFVIECFHSVIVAWSKSKKPDAAMKADAMLRKVISLKEKGEVKDFPKIISYGAAISAWIGSGHKNCLDQAEKLLFEMEECGLKPFANFYSNILTAATESNAPDRALDILNHMIKRYEQGVDSAKPTRASYAMVVSAYARRGNAPMAEKVLQDQINRYMSSGDQDLSPGFSIFSSVINAWSKSGRPNAGPMAEAVLQRMNALAESRPELSLSPDVWTYNGLLKAWSHTPNRNAPLRCEEILISMHALAQRGQTDVEPNVISYNYYLRCLAKSSIPDAPERCEKILRHMVRLHENGNKNVKPNNVSYNEVMNAWALTPNAAERIQALFDELLRHYDAGDKDMKPTVHVFGTVITAWSRTKHSGSAMRAQAVFDNMLSRYQSGDLDLKPGIVQCNALVDAWAKAGSPERAERILREMESNKSLNVRPNHFTYSSVINGWVISEVPDAAERIQALFDEMLQKYYAGVRELKPNLRTYITLITAWGRSERKDSAAKAQAAFDMIYSRWNSGEDDMKPDEYVHSAMMTVWARRGEVEKVEKIFYEMQSNSSSSGATPYATAASRRAGIQGWAMSGIDMLGDLLPNESGKPGSSEIIAGDMASDRLTGVKPSVVSYSIMMGAWSRSSHPEAVQRTQALFDELMEKYNAGDHQMKPTIQVYAALIGAWSRRSRKLGARKDVRSKAEAVYAEMLSQYRSGDKKFEPLLHRLSAEISSWANRWRNGTV